MTWWEMVLQVFKFVAILVSAASGWYATLHDTREASGALTKAGRVVLRCVIASSIVALTIQALETKNAADKAAEENRSRLARQAVDEAERKTAETARAEQIRRLEVLQHTAMGASINADSSAAKSEAAVTGLARISAGQQTAAEAAWRLARPFGAWKVHARFDDAPLGEVAGARAWVQRVIARAREADMIGPVPTFVIRSSDPLYPAVEDDRYLMGLDSLSRLTISDALPATSGPGTAAEILGYDLKPLEVAIVATIDVPRNMPKRFDVIIDYECVPQMRTAAISNWVDLYGRELTFEQGGSLGRSGNLAFGMSYTDTMDSRRLRFQCPKCRRAGAVGLTQEFRIVLTEEHLERFPGEYRRDFPQQFSQIMARVNRAKRVGALRK